MDGTALPLALIAAGSLPGVIAIIAVIILWQRRTVLEEQQTRMWVRLGYLWLALFCVVALILTWNVDADSTMVAFGWIALPAFVGIFGLWVFAERQRMTLEEFPSPRRMHEVSMDNRQELRYVTSELSNDLNRSLGAQGAVAKGAAVGLAAGQGDDIDRLIARLRSCIQRCNELDARYGLHLRRLKTMMDQTADGQYTAEQARQLEERQQTQHELDRSLDRLIDTAVDCRAAVNRSLQNVNWT